MESHEKHPTGQPEDRRDGERELTLRELPLSAATFTLSGTGEQVHLSPGDDGIFVQWDRGGSGGAIGCAATWRQALALAADYIAAELIASGRVPV